jgi:hypothetical protein
VVIRDLLPVGLQFESITAQSASGILQGVGAVPVFGSTNYTT